MFEGASLSLPLSLLPSSLGGGELSGCRSYIYTQIKKLNSAFNKKRKKNV
jgi:hypothetical protein